MYLSTFPATSFGATRSGSTTTSASAARALRAGRGRKRSAVRLRSDGRGAAASMGAEILIARLYAAAATDRNRWAPPSGSGGHAVRLREGVVGVGERRVAEALVPPAGAPAVADDEAVGRVADQRHRVAAAGGLGPVRVEVAGVVARVVPRAVHVEPREDRALGGEPALPLLDVARPLEAQVVVARDLQLGGAGVERLLLPREELAGGEGQHLLAHGAVLAGHVERRLQARPGHLDEGRGRREELVGLLRGHPGEARRGQQPGLVGVLQAPVAVGVARRHDVEDPLDGLRLRHSMGLRGCGGCGEEVILPSMADNDQYADLVFEGGGGKGIGLAGAYAALSKRGFEPKCVAGTSAGGITPGLGGAGYSSAELDRILLELPFSDFKDPDWWDKAGTTGRRRATG